jgi:hypothetical protein
LNLASRVKAQDRTAKADALREQIEALQQHLQDLERGPESKRRISEIDPGNPQARDEAKVEILRAYDLNDLFAPLPQYPARHPGDLDGASAELFSADAQSQGETLQGMGGGMGGMGGGMGGGGFYQVSSSPTSGSSISQLISVIQDSTTGPWEDVDGEGGRITRLGTTLLIRTTLETHLQIERLLDVLRNLWGTLKIVRVEVDWLWLRQAEVDALVPEAEGSVIRVVSDDNLQSMRESQGNERPRGRSAQITCYNGQTVNVQSVRLIPAVTSLTPVVSTEAASYQPMVRTLSEGAVAQVRPLVSRSGNFIVLDVHSRVNEVEVADAPPYDGLKPKLDQVTLMTHRLATSLRAPAGVATLVGGMTHTSLHSELEETFNLYLFVRATSEEIEEAPTENLSTEDVEAAEDAEEAAPEIPGAPATTDLDR